MTPPLHRENTGKFPSVTDAEFAPDLPELASALGKSEEFVVEQHTSATYKVYMYGFAPGYAYLGGVPPVIQHPRKPTPRHGGSTQGRDDHGIAGVNQHRHHAIGLVGHRAIRHQPTARGQ